MNDEYNTLYTQATTELDPAKQAELFIAMNDMVVEQVVEIALVHRNGVSAANTKLRGYTRSVYETDIYDVVNWYFEE